jgi:hypothetical protein
MRPGDTDAEFFADYTDDQLAWAEAHADSLQMVAFDRYGNA